MESKSLYVIIFLVILGVGGGVYSLSTKSQKDSGVLSQKTETIQTQTPSGTLTTVEDLKKEDLTVGTGTEATIGKSVTVNYEGTLTDGTKFDSSYDRGEPFSFSLGAGEVIKGWDQGVVGMRIGGKRKLTIPANLAYGDNGVPGAIPGGATLVFTVELLKVE